MTKHGISFTLGSLFTLFVAIIFLNLGLFASGTDLIEDGQHTALNFVNIAHAQSDEQMVSETYPSPAKQLKDGVGMHDIQCNDSRELYIRQSQIPVCLYAETYDLMQSRGIELVPATPSSSSTGIFTSEEAQWLADNPVIRVSFDPGWTPIEYADESGNLQGITLDYIAEFEAISGADLVPVPAAGTWADALMAVEERNAEIMYIVASTPERLEYMSFTSPHYTIKTSMISLNDTPLNIDDEGLRLITIRSYAIEAWLDENHPDIEYIPVDSPADAYALLAAGGADAFTSVWPAATHHAKMSGVDNVYNVGTTGHQYDLTVGYRNDLPLLGSIMQKVLDQIPQEKIDSWYDVTLTLADVDLTPESIVMGVVDDIIALYDSDPENAFEQITSMMATDPSYPFVLDYDTGIIVAHGSNPELVNVLSTSIADLDRPFDVIRSDLLEGHTWVKYTFENPATGTEQVKLSLFVLHDGYIFGSGYYTEHDVTLTLADVDLTPESIVMGVVDDIIALYDSDPENAFEQITSMMATDPSYPFVLDYDTGVIVAHGSNPELVNVLSTSIADLDRPFDVIRSDLLEGHTWVKYTFENPATGTEQVKLSLFVLHDGYIFGSGYYTEHDVTLTLADVDLTPESIVMGVVDDIIALYDSDPENAFEQITSMMATDPSYPFVLDYDTGVIVAHGSNPELVNVLSTSIADLDRPFDVIRSDLLEGHTWVKYTFENPATGTEQVKLSLFVLHDGYIFGSGYYTEHDVTLTLADVDLTPESIVMGVVDDIIALYDSDPENAFEQITSMMATDPSYPFVLDYDTGVIVAHGSNPELVNVLSTSIADLDRPFDVIRSDLLEGHTWVKYTFENPATGTEQVKLSLFVLHDGYIFGSGYYTELTPADIFSPEEVEWLENNPVIRVSFDPGWTPIEYADESGNLQGVTLDYIAEFEAISGADLVPVPAAGTWADALMAVEERNAEIMYMVASAPERLEYMSFTSPHYTVKTTLVSLSNTPLNIDDEGLTLVTINGYAIEAWLDENHPDIEYIPVDSPADAYALLAAGGADAFTSVWPAATHHAKMSGVDNVYNVGTTGHQYDLTVGYRNDLPLLGSIMQKTLDNIPQERIDSWYDAVAQTTDDAETLESVVIGVIDDAIALYDSDPANAFGQITSMELTNPQYPFAMDYLTTQIVAHGAFPERVGEIAVALTESNIPLDVILSDLKKGNVWAEYVFANPSTGIEQTKRSLYVLHEGYIFSSGYYITS